MPRYATFMYTPHTFITEPHHLVTWVQLLLMTVTVSYMPYTVRYKTLDFRCKNNSTPGIAINWGNTVMAIVWLGGDLQGINFLCKVLKLVFAFRVSCE